MVKNLIDTILPSIKKERRKQFLFQNISDSIFLFVKVFKGVRKEVLNYIIKGPSDKEISEEIGENLRSELALVSRIHKHGQEFQVLSEDTFSPKFLERIKPRFNELYSLDFSEKFYKNLAKGLYGWAENHPITDPAGFDYETRSTKLYITMKKEGQPLERIRLEKILKDDKWIRT